MGHEHLTSTTTREYTRYVELWRRAGEPEPNAWLATLTPHVWRNARAALAWQARREGRTLSLIQAPRVHKVPEAFTEEQVAQVLQLSRGVSYRLPAVCSLLYSTGARLGEAVGIRFEDVTETHVVLRVTKRRPGGMRVERAIPLGPVSRAAIEDLRSMPGRADCLLGIAHSTVRRQLRLVDALVPYRVHAHKFRATFATRLLERGVDVRTVQELMGHTDLATTMRYLAVTDERKSQAVALL